MDMALSNVERRHEIEEEAGKIRRGELLKQFKQEMGLEGPAETGGATRPSARRSGSSKAHGSARVTSRKRS